MVIKARRLASATTVRASSEISPSFANFLAASQPVDLVHWAALFRVLVRGNTHFGKPEVLFATRHI
jgi:hypothetical protein